MIKLNKIIVHHSLDCIRELPIKGDSKIEAINVEWNLKTRPK